MNISHGRKRLAAAFAALLPALLFLSACRTTAPTYELTVFNAGPEPVRDVEIEYHGTVKSRADRLDGEAGSTRTLKGETMPRDFLVRWKDRAGNAWEKSLHHPGPFTRPFMGELYFRIAAGGEAQVFRYKSQIKPASKINWAEKKDWEGKKLIPGIINVGTEPEL